MGTIPGGCWKPDCGRCSRIFRDGLSCSELRIAPLGGALFGADTTPLLDRLEWGERAVAILLDRLIWIFSNRGERARVHYGSLDVEDLGSVYEGLLEQEPGIATEPLVRVRRGKLEAVVPAGEAHRRTSSRDNSTCAPEWAARRQGRSTPHMNSFASWCARRWTRRSRRSARRTIRILPDC